MDEFSVIKRFFTRSKIGDGLVQGSGDDCAVMSVDEGYELVSSVDTLVEGVHFFKGAPADLIAQRSAFVAISDIAAMGARAKWVSLSISIPAVDKDWLSGFSRGFYAALDQCNCKLVGGDTTKGPLSISVHVMGVVPVGQSLLRSGAKVGDKIFVTGSLGDAAAALAVISESKKLGEEGRTFFEKRYWQPEPKLQESLILRELANSAIDISDGLLADLNHICEASEVYAELDLASLPLAPEVVTCFGLEQGQAFALTGGDDYHLCFTVPKANVEALEKNMQAISKSLHCIGEIKDEIKPEEKGVVPEPIFGRIRTKASVSPQLKKVMASGGYRHFIDE